MDAIVERLRQEDSIGDFISLILEPPKDILGSIIEKDLFTLILTCVLYTTWFFRNEKLFEGQKTIVQAIRFLHNSVSEFGKLFLDKDNTPLAGREKNCWVLHPQGWIKINIDAAVGISASTLAVVARDHSGKLIYIASSMEPVMVAAQAELKALEWASGKASELGWTNVLWCSDAINLINDVVSVLEPIGWKSRDDLIAIKHRSKDRCWRFSWTPRETNMLADLVAKHSLVNLSNLLFVASLSNLPLSFLKQIWIDCAGVSSV